jgi:site-specific recombinase XerD
MGCKTHRNALIPPLPLAPDFEPYCLRHTYCTDLCKAGVDIRTAQRLMGHANISITADIYTHVDVNDIIQAGEKINEYYRRAK